MKAGLLSTRPASRETPSAIASRRDSRRVVSCLSSENAATNFPAATADAAKRELSAWKFWGAVSDDAGRASVCALFSSHFSDLGREGGLLGRGRCGAQPETSPAPVACRMTGHNLGVCASRARCSTSTMAPIISAAAGPLSESVSTALLVTATLWQHATAQREGLESEREAPESPPNCTASSAACLSREKWEPVASSVGLYTPRRLIVCSSCAVLLARASCGCCCWLAAPAGVFCCFFFLEPERESLLSFLTCREARQAPAPGMHSRQLGHHLAAGILVSSCQRPEARFHPAAVAQPPGPAARGAEGRQRKQTHGIGAIRLLLSPLRMPGLPCSRW